MKWHMSDILLSATSRLPLLVTLHVGDDSGDDISKTATTALRREKRMRLNGCYTWLHYVGELFIVIVWHTFGWYDTNVGTTLPARYD